QDQLRTPRFDLPVLGVRVTNDRRTLLLATAPQPEAASYALTLPGLGRPALPDAKKRELPQAPETDLCYDLSGVEASWHAQQGDASWSGWLPHLDLGVARPLTAASALHDRLWDLLHQPGRLTLRTQLNLGDMLRPAVQPGSRIDHVWPAEEVAVVFRSTAAFEVKSPGKVAPVETDKEGRRVLRVTVRPAADTPIPFEVTV